MGLFEQIAEGEYLTYEDAAKLLNSSRAHIQRIANDRRNSIRVIRPSRKKLVNKADLENYLVSTMNSK